VIVEPYRRPPQPPLMALMTADRRIVDERGELVFLDEFPKTHRAYMSYDTVRRLVDDGYGEAVCWNGEELHWRHERFEDDWKPRRSDVHVLKLADGDDDLLTLRALCRWRDWLASYGAAPTGTTGSAAWSLLRATLRGELRTSEPFPSCPPLRSTMGGRQALGPAGQGRFAGRLELWDMPSAYARELGGMLYGGRWYNASRDIGPVKPEMMEGMARAGYPVFVKALVQVPDGLGLGPLPRRPRSGWNAAARMALGCEYPVGRRILGVWCWEELRQAVEAGARVLQLRDYWFHVSETRPFVPWLAAVEQGRKMPGVAGVLAKMTGNALWGRFCMDSRFGVRTIRSAREGHVPGDRLSSRRLVFRGGQPPAHDLAETVSGRTRARLYGEMVAAGDRLVSAHTDGLWLKAAAPAPPASLWRCKARASWIELLTPQTLRYLPRPARDGARVVFAGMPPALAGEEFEKAWQRAGLAA